MPATSNGEQRVLVSNAPGLHCNTQFLMQKYLNLVDWKGLELSSSMRRCKVSVKKFGHSPEWIERKETLVEFQAERCKKTSDDEVSDDMTSKAECKRKSGASPVQFCHRRFVGGNEWNFLTDLL